MDYLNVERKCRGRVVFACEETFWCGQSTADYLRDGLDMAVLNDFDASIVEGVVDRTCVVPSVANCVVGGLVAGRESEVPLFWKSKSLLGPSPSLS